MYSKNNVINNEVWKIYIINILSKNINYRFNYIFN